MKGILGPLAIAAVAIAQLWPGLSAGLAPPISWDHGAHFGKAALVAEELLPFLRGWSDRVELGVPQHVLYTPTGTIWILLFRALTPFLEWHQTYALAFCGFRALVGLTVYRLARVAGAGRAGATFAGILALADHGDHSEGGWFYDVVFGVWPMALAMCVFFLGLADLLAFLDGGRRSSAVRAMILLGIALFSHQASLLALGAIGPALLLVRAIERASIREDVARMAKVFLPAGMIAAWWMLPMLAQSEWLDDHGQLYRSTVDMGRDMVAGAGVLRGGAWTGPLVGIGLLAALLSRGHRRTLAIGALLAMLIASPGWLLQFDFVRWLPSLGRIVYPRMMMIAKPVLFALVGCAIHDLVVRLAPALRAQASSWKGRAGILATMLLLAPFLPEVPGVIDDLVLDRDVTTTASLSDWEDRRAAWAWLRDRPSSPFFRALHYDDTTHLPQAAAAFSGHPALVYGVLVGEAFRNTADTTDPRALRAMNVRYVVARSIPSGLHGQLTEIARFGDQRIFELHGWDPRIAIDPSGAAEPSVLALERERVVLAPRGARALVLRRAFAPGWRAWADGNEIAITPERIEGSARARFMRVEVPAGTQRIEYAYVGLRGLIWLGWLISWLGLALVALYAIWPWLSETRRAPIEALPDRLPPWLRAHGHRIAILLPLLALLAAIARGASGHHFAYDLERARISIRRRDGAVEPCTSRPAEGDGWACASQPHVSIRRLAMIVDGRFHSCMSAYPPRGGVLQIAWPSAPLRSSLRLGGGISDETFAGGRGEPLEVRLRIDGELRETLVIPNGREWVERVVETPSGEHEVVLEIDAPDPERRWLCLDAIAR